MEPPKLLVGAGFFIFLLVGSWVRARKRDRLHAERRVELAQFVQGRGWSHTPSKRGGADRYCGVEPLPDKGVNIDAWDYITGEFRGRAFCCFEYRTREFDPGNTTPGDRWLFYTLFAITAPTSVPGIIVRRPQLGDKLETRMLGRGQVVELGIPAFDEAFRIITDDEPFARMMAGHLAQFLPSDLRAKDAPLQFHGNELITWCRGKIQREQIEPSLNYLCDVLDRIPAQAWRSV